MRKFLLPLFIGVSFIAQAQKMLPVKQHGKWGFINLDGKIVIEPAYDEAAVFKNGYAVVGINGKRGIIDSVGKIVIPAEYEGAEPLASGYFALRKGKWSLADLTGKVYGNFNYDIIRSLDYNTIQLIDSGRSYLFHIPTQHLNDNYWDRVGILESGKWYTVWKQGKIGILNNLHQVFTKPLVAQEILYDQNIFVIKNGARYGFINQKGEPVLEAKAWLYYKVIHPEVLVVYDNPSELSLLNLRDHKLILQNDYHQYRVLNEDFIVCVKLHLEGLANWNGDILIPNEYESISYYGGDGMLQIKKNGNTGVVSSSGKIIIPADYTFIDPFDKYNRAVAGKGGKYGILARNGGAIIPFIYDNFVIEEDVIKGYDGESMDVYTLNAKGLPEDKVHFNQVQTIQLNKRYRPQPAQNIVNTDIDFSTRNFSLVDTESGGFEFNGRFERKEKSVSYNAKSRIKCIIPKNYENVWNLCGVWDTTRKRRIAELEYWDIRVSELNIQNWARIILPGGRQGLISKNGAIKTQFPIKKGTRTAPANIAYVGPYKHGLARINVGGKLNNNTTSGSWSDFRPSLRGYSLWVQDGMWGYINGNGEMQIPAEYTYLTNFTNGKSIAGKGGKFGVIDTLNHFVIPLKYDEITYLPDCKDQYFKLSRSTTRYGLLDANGHVILKAEYQYVGYPSEGLVPVKQNDHWGFVDMNGTVVIQPEYEMVSPFSDGLALIKKKALIGFIDHTGKVVIDCKYGSALDVHEGKIPVKLQGKWGYLDKTGHIV